MKMIDTKMYIQLSPEVLRTFNAAVETRSFTHAGTVVHRTQSAVSMQMKKLESELGTALFEREGRGVTLTPEGEILHRYAQRLLSLHAEALAALTVPRVNGIVRFGAPEDYASQYLPHVLKRFSAAYPDIAVDVFCDASPTLRKLFSQGELDVMLTTEEQSLTHNSHTIDLTWLLPEHENTAQVSPLPLALFHSGCLYRQNALSALEEAGMPYRIAYGSPSMAGVLAAVRAGLAIAPVTQACQATGCRKATRLDGLPTMRPVAIALHRSGSSSQANHAFHAFLEQELAQTRF